MKKKRGYKALWDRAWDAFKLHIKNRDDWTCITCGKVEMSSTMNAGHFVHKSVGSEAYFWETNVHAQCARCNCWLNGDGGLYAQKIIEKYGYEELKRLNATRGKIYRHTEEELQKIIDTYQQDNSLTFV